MNCCMKPKTILLLILFSSTLHILVRTEDDDFLTPSVVSRHLYPKQQDDTSLLDIMKGLRNGKGGRKYTYFVSLLKYVGFHKVFKNCDAGPFTVFPWNDASFERLGKENHKKLYEPQNLAEVRRLLKYSIVRGRFTTSKIKQQLIDYKEPGGNITALTHIPTVLKGFSLEVEYESDFEDFWVNDAYYSWDRWGAWINRPDFEGCNGVVHGINAILLPESDGLI